MNKLLTALGLLTISLSTLNSQNLQHMKLNAGIVTEKLQESKAFYMNYLNFKLIFENEFYVLLSTPDGSTELSFLAANHPTQQPIFHKKFLGQGVYLTIELEDVDLWYKRIRNTDVMISLALRDEPWGDRHFAITDPNGVNIDIVRFTAPE